MDGHGIPIVTSNDVHSKSIFTIPPCDYSIECPESKRFATVYNNNNNNEEEEYSKGGNVNHVIYDDSGTRNDDDGSEGSSKDGHLYFNHDNDKGSNDAILIHSNGNSNNNDHNNNAINKNGHHGQSRANPKSKDYWEDKLQNDIPNCTYTKPIPFSNTVQLSSTTATSMNAIGHDIHKLWDTIMTIRYYNIIQRDVKVIQLSRKSQQDELEEAEPPSILPSTALITTTITTVADIQLQITPTAKPFNSYTPSFDRSMMNEMTTSSSSSLSGTTTTHYNYSITLFAKSYTNEYNLEEKLHDNDDNKNQTNTSTSTTRKMKTSAQIIMQEIRINQKKMESPCYTWSDVIPQIIFSSNDNKYISCIIPHPILIDEKNTITSISGGGSDVNHHHDKRPSSLSSIVIFTLDWKTKRIIRNGQHQHQQQSNEQSVATAPTNTTSSSNTKTSLSSMTKKIPIPSYIQSIIDEEEEQKFQPSSSASKIESTSSSTPSSFESQSSKKKKRAMIPIVEINNITMNNSPTVQNPRVVSVDMDMNMKLFHDNVDDIGNDNVMMSYNKASRLLSQITTICDIHVDNDEYENGINSGISKKKNNVHPLLLAGCTDGSILLIGYKRAKLIALLHDPNCCSQKHRHMQECWMSPEDKDGLQNDYDLDDFTMIQKHCGSINNSNSWNQNKNGIQQLMYMYSPNQKENEDRFGCGRLVAIHRNALVSFYETKFYTTSAKKRDTDRQPTHHPVVLSLLDLKLCQQQRLQQEEDNQGSYQTLPMIHGVYLDYNTVAFLVDPFYNAFHDNQKEDYQTFVQVWYIDDKQANFVLMNELKSNNERLMDLNHGFLSMKRVNGPGKTYTSPVCVRLFGANFKLNYDRRTNSLVVSSAVTSLSKTLSKKDDDIIAKQISVFLKPFLLIWKWRTSVTGFTLIGESFMKYSLNASEQRPYLMNDWEMVRNESNSYSLQDVCVCTDTGNGNSLAYITEFDDESLQKELFSVGILSPSSSRTYGSVRGLHFPSTIFLTHDSVSYLDSLKASVTKDMKMQWRQSQVPQSYRSSNGSLNIAAIGEKHGRSIAVAASRGFCVLDLSIGKDEGSLSKNMSFEFPTSCEEGFKCYNGSISSGVGANNPKWKMFNKIEETTFSVQAMTWWERTNELNGASEDILIGVVRYADEGKFHITGWSRRRLGLDKQLIKDKQNIDTELQIGTPLPDGFFPDDIALLIEPDSNGDRAILLLSSRCKGGYKYALCQLHYFTDEDRNCMVFANLVSVETLFDYSLPADPLSNPKICSIFLAGADFKYDLTSLKLLKTRDTEITATIGVIHNLGRSVSSFTNPSLKVNKVFDLNYASNNKPKIHWIEKLWLSDVQTSKSSDEYLMDFSFLSSDGSNYVWSKLSNKNETITEERDSFVLGPLQLYPDDDPEKSKIFLGPLSSISDRFLVYAAQERRKIHLSQSNQFDSKDLSVYCVSDCIIGVPTFTSSLVSHCTQRLKGNEAKRRQPITLVKQKRKYDSTTSAIRVIVSFVTDQLYRLRHIRSVDRLSFYEKMLTDLVGLTKASLSTVHFTWIFLNIARQLEQHHLDQMFPLSLQSEDSLEHISVRDLFYTSVSKGSLPVASSSLPLPIFSSTETLHQHCLDLLHHCITTIFDFLAGKDSTNLWCIREECFFLQQIYNYTMKLEDSFDAQQVEYGDSFDSELYHDESFDASSGDYENVHGLEDSRFVSDGSEYNSGAIESFASDASSYAEIEIQMQPQTPSRIKRIASALKPLFTRSTKKNKDDEVAIAAAASTFVLSGFEDKSLQHVDSVHDEFGIASPGSMILDDTMSEDISDTLPKNSSSEVLGKAIALCAFQALNPSSVKGKISYIAVFCTLIQSNCSDRDYEVEHFIQLVQSIPEEIYSDLSEVYVEGDCDESGSLVGIMMERLVSMCSEEWSREDAKAVLDVILTILARHKEASEVDYYIPVLVIIATVSCNMLGVGEKLKTDERFVSTYIYNELIDIGFSI